MFIEIPENERKTYVHKVSADPELDHLRFFCTPIGYEDGRYLICNIELKMIKQPTQ